MSLRLEAIRRVVRDEIWIDDVTLALEVDALRRLGLAERTEKIDVLRPHFALPDDVRAQLARPAFARVADLRVRYLPYSELAKNREVMARFGHGLRPIEAVARTLT